MAGKTFQFRLITPQGKLMDSRATSATLPAHDGLMGILPDRAAMVIKLGVGELSVHFEGEKGAAGGDRAYVIEEGFAQMISNRLTILTTRATPAESIVLAEAEASLAEASARRPETGGGASVARDKARATALVRTARARAGKGI
ncbi:MAG: F0F1 ATP synthase subunit epsilon [Phycisphaerales bacterium]